VKPSRLLLVLAVLPFAALRFTAGCAGQGEGQLCSTLNNTSDDCAAGLVCTPKIGYMACCPPTGSTQPACMGNGNGPGGAGGSLASSSSSSATGTGGGGTGGTGTGGTGTGGTGTGGTGTGGTPGTGGAGLDGGSGG